MMGREELLQKFWKTVYTQLTENPWFYKREKFEINDRRAVKGYRTGALRIDCGIRNEELLGILTAPILYQLTPWNIDSSARPSAYIDRRHVVIESPWPEALQINDVPLSSIGTAPRDGLHIVTGPNQRGETITLSIDDLIHILVAGVTGSGKSWFMRSIAYQLRRCRFVFCDGKMGDTVKILDGLPGQIGPLAIDTDSITAALTWTVAEMNRRYAAGSNLPYDDIVVLFDEFQDFTAGGTSAAIVAALRKLAAQGRGAHIHLVLGTQTPSAEMWGTGSRDTSTKYQIQTRIGLQVMSRQASEAAMDATEPSLMHLMPKGDAFVKSPSSNGRTCLERVQLAYVAPAEFDGIARQEPELRAWPHPDLSLLDDQAGVGRGRPARILSDLQLAAAIHAARQVPPFGRPAYQELLKRVGDPLPANPVADEAIRQGRKLASLLEEIENKDSGPRAVDSDGNEFTVACLP